MSHSVDEIRPLLGDDLDVVGDPDGRSFDTVAPITTAGPNALVWINPTRNDQLELAQRTRAELVICHTSLDVSGIEGKCFLKVPAPKLAIVRVVEALFAPPRPSGVHPSAVLDESADVHPTAYVGPLAYIGRATVGEGSAIGSHCHIADGVHIGRNVTIGPGCVIGGEGYNYARDADGIQHRFPHIGGVTIEDDVEIHALTNVDRGVLGDTIVRRGAKIDSLVHIAHNVEVGENASVIALSMVGGSTRLGARSWIAPSAVLRDVLSIGEDAIVGLGAVVVKDVPAGQTVAGNPARPIDEQRRILARLRELGAADVE